MQHVLVDTPATLSQSWYLNGTISDPGVVTVTVTNLAGTALVTNGATAGSGAEARTYALTTTETANMDTLKAVWTSSVYGEMTSYLEVVGDLLFSEVEARAFDGGKLSNASTYTDAAISAARARIAEDFTEILGVAPYPRYKRVVMDGSGCQDLLLPDLLVTAIREAAYRTSGGTDWTAFDSDDLDDAFASDYGVLYRESRGIWPCGRQNVRVGYEHGFAKVPAPIKHAALLVLTGGTAQSIVGSDIDYRATSFSDGIGTIRFLTPGIGRGDVFYSEPDVNRILQTYRRRVPGLA